MEIYNLDETSTRNRIIIAAARITVEHGYESCTMRRISLALGIKTSSIYYHFACKDDIISELMNVSIETLYIKVHNDLDSLSDTSSSYDRFLTAVKSHVEAKTHPDFMLLRVFEFLPPIIKRRGRDWRRKYESFWQELVQNVKNDGVFRQDLDVRFFVSVLLSTLNRAPEWFSHTNMVAADVGTLLVKTLCQGIGTDPTDSAH